MVFPVNLQFQLSVLETKKRRREGTVHWQRMREDLKTSSIHEAAEEQRDIHCSKKLRSDSAEFSGSHTKVLFLLKKALRHVLDHPEWDQKKEIKILKDRFVVFPEAIGRGKFGVVRRCWDSCRGRMLACKTISKSSNRNRSASLMRSAHAEIEAATLLSGHSQVVRCDDIVEETDGTVHLLMELCSNGDLYELLSKEKHLVESEAASLFRQIVSAVDFCHSRGVVHRDIKPENVMLCSEFPAACNPESVLRAKLGDFGHSIVLGPDRCARGVVGSPSYIAPEVILGRPYGFASDVWSLGVLLYVMLSGLMPYLGNTVEETFDLIVHCAPDLSAAAPWKHISPNAKHLVKSMLNHKPHLRPTASEILSHPWLLEH